MSQQSKPFEAPGFGIDVVRGLKAAIARAAAAIHSQRQAEADRIVRSVVADRYSDEDLATYGWSAADIRRFRSL